MLTLCVSHIFGLEGRPVTLSRLWLKNPRAASWHNTQYWEQKEKSLNSLAINITDNITHRLSAFVKHFHTCYMLGYTNNLQTICWYLEFDSVSSTFLSCTRKSITNPFANCIWTARECCRLQTDACGKCWWWLSLLLCDYCKFVWSKVLFG